MDSQPGADETPEVQLNPGSRLLGKAPDAQLQRVGSTLRRSRHARSEFVAQLLLDLEAAGFARSPRYLGIGENGRDILSYVPGQTTNHPSQRDERCYRAVGQILRHLHDLTSASDLASGAECVIHGDAGPYNMVLEEGMPLALIDWDRARPGTRLEEIAFAAWTWCLGVIGNIPLADQLRRIRAP